MTSLSDWLRRRRPPAPEALGDAVRRAVAEAGPASPLAALDASGRTLLTAAASRPGRVRESAFHLLTADALVTYACEAALEADDPVAALEGLLGAGDRA